MQDEQKHVDAMQSRITDEIFSAMGLSRNGLLRRSFGWVFYPPTRRFARIFARADAKVGEGGMGSGCRQLIEDFKIRLRVRGVENIPQEGPLVVVSNHPGAYDSVCLASCVQREDLKILVRETAFFHTLPNTDRLFIHASGEPTGRMVAMRSAIQHLREGGSMLHFGSGRIEPDPSAQSGAEAWLEKWSPSLEIMLQKAPETRLVQAVISGVLLPKFLRHPVTLLRRDPIARRRLAEFMQVIQHLLVPRSVKVNVCISFAQPVSVTELAAQSTGRRLMPAVLVRQARLLADHVREYGIPTAPMA